MNATNGQPRVDLRVRSTRVDEIRWEQHGKLRVGSTAAGKVVVRCPKCSCNIKIAREEIPSIVTE